MLWTKNKNIPELWRNFTETSRYFDQASIEDLVSNFNTSYFEFGEEYNVQSWRFIVGNETGKTIASYITPNLNERRLNYKNRTLKTIHTHFTQPQFKEINQFFIHQLQRAGMYKELLIIYRIINNKWIIHQPKQPMAGMGRHNNDSFRQMPVMLRSKHKDIDVVLDEKSIHMKLEPNIMLNDRDTLQWIDKEASQTPLMLLGNCDIKTDGTKLKNTFQHMKIMPWIYWPRSLMLVEKILKTKDILSFNTRTIESIFIGNFENSVQEKYRKTNANWGDFLTEYHCTAGKKHKFSHEEYLMKLRESKFGLCIRGYGVKCHREVELMAFGTIPIITPEVCIDSFYDPPIENIHYLRVSQPSDIPKVIESITEEKWESMSKACIEWYKRNVHTDNMWGYMMQHIFEM